MSPAAPSGEQIELAAGDQKAVVVEVGGGLRTYAAAGRDLLFGYGRYELCASGRGQVLAPWPNRLEDGSYEFDGRRHELPLDEPERRNAIHGLVRWAAWRVKERGPSRVTLEHVLHPRPGYPFSLALELEYTLSSDGLTVETRATNVGSDPCPFGAGAHPYLRVAESADDVVLTVPAGRVLSNDERGLPAGIQEVEGTQLDFRRPRPIGAEKIDNTFTGLDRDGDGRARVELTGPSGAATVWADGAYPWVQVFTGDLPDVRREGVAVEPMTCPANAFRTGESLIRLEPGASFTGSWGITPG
ncbi:MAG TPA: aldose 1-epimerase family protein [Gaiellaceae bacterium]